MIMQKIQFLFLTDTKAIDLKLTNYDLPLEGFYVGVILALAITIPLLISGIKRVNRSYTTKGRDD